MSIKKKISFIFPIIVLSFLMVSAFFLRLDNFKNSPARSIDEVVYYRMAKQFHKNPVEYNTIPYAEDLKAQGRPLPEYFSKPLFKYPPLFVFLISLSFHLFKVNFISAFYIVLATGVLTIPLTYLLAKLIFNRKTALLSAALISMDPVSIITSQKLWLDTPLAFFTLLSIYFFAKALKADKNFYFILSGIAVGLATLMKYPGIFLLPAYGTYLFLFAKNQLRNKGVWLSFAIPFIMLLPWFYWNYQVYGWDFILLQINLHSSKLHQKETLLNIGIIAFATIITTALFIMKRKVNTNYFTLKHLDPKRKERLRYLIFTVICIFLFENIIRSLMIANLPTSGWQSSMFRGEPFYFYLGRLVEFSLLFIFAILAFFLKTNNDYPLNTFLKTITFIILGLYIFWGNYQSRYILTVIPLMLILASAALIQIFTLLKEKNTSASQFQLAGLILFILYALTKTTLINLHLSFPNDLCYF